MRTSCNGCRVLRKGCSEDCNIRPCLHWIKSPESQANATVFLAKFYGRAGLMNLINAGPDNLRPAIFKSLLYEACGRVIDPIQGSVGLLWSGNWNQCQAAVDAVLKGSSINQIQPHSDAAASALAPASHLIPPLNFYDIRHVSRDTNFPASPEIHPIKTRTRSKRIKSKPDANSGTEFSALSAQFGNSGSNGAPSHDQGESMFSAETVEPSLVNWANPDPNLNQIGDGEIGLELSLGLPK